MVPWRGNVVEGLVIEHRQALAFVSGFSGAKYRLRDCIKHSNQTTP